MPRYIRVYRCPDCGHSWKTESQLGFIEPDCPQCGFHPDPLPDRVCAPAIVGSKSRAVDEAYRVVSEDYGLGDLKDNAREGESSIKLPSTPPQNTITPNNAVQKAGGFMWGAGGSGQVAAPAKSIAQLRAQGAAAAKLNDAQGTNPMRLLHQAKPVLQQHSLGNFTKR